MIPGEVLVERPRDIGEQEGDFAGQGVGEDGGQCRECNVGANSDARDGPIDEDDNGSEGVDVFLDLSRNALV